MGTDEEIAPTVKSILAAARSRTETNDRVSVTPRSLSDAFATAEADGRVPIIAEIKPTSPTTSSHNQTDPVQLAHEMIAGGATALSVLTEPDHFGGSTESLRRVRETVDVPILRKDFILQEPQLDAVEADIILLIARFVNNLSELLTAAQERGFQVLIEVHSRSELESAIAAGGKIIGINNRDLAQLNVDLSTFERIAPYAPDDATLIAESGLSTVADVRRMRAAGADGLLIGTAIMDGNVTTNTRRLSHAE